MGLVSARRGRRAEPASRRTGRLGRAVARSPPRARRRPEPHPSRRPPGQEDAVRHGRRRRLHPGQQQGARRGRARLRGGARVARSSALGHHAARLGGGRLPPRGGCGRGRGQTSAEPRRARGPGPARCLGVQGGADGVARARGAPSQAPQAHVAGVSRNLFPSTAAAATYCAFSDGSPLVSKRRVPHPARLAWSSAAPGEHHARRLREPGGWARGLGAGPRSPSERGQAGASAGEGGAEARGLGVAADADVRGPNQQGVRRREARRGEGEGSGVREGGQRLPARERGVKPGCQAARTSAGPDGGDSDGSGEGAAGDS
mmetsp:Transcript_35337/g.67574  ORF Transcript_35337/g.67574 Transcript_35337/m.67574 type:complete len:317 (-) Transcript_35337:775-1725(-)